VDLPFEQAPQPALNRGAMLFGFFGRVDTSHGVVLLGWEFNICGVSRFARDGQGAAQGDGAISVRVG
jgi:hypothetical protein